MLEANTFRAMMMMGGLISLGLIFTFMFVTPVMTIDVDQRTNYENVMNVELDTRDYKITAYEALTYTVKAKLRGGISHY